MRVFVAEWIRVWIGSGAPNSFDFPAQARYRYLRLRNKPEN
ncbi:MAG: hypothetical protein NZ739_08455 [Verrucomicrobiae bacterium]|nr:hypothetical protein [Verrucomicrobiae bacterium]